MGVQFRNVSGEARYVTHGLIPPWVPYHGKPGTPTGRRVEVDGMFTVEDAAASSYDGQPNVFERVDASS